MRATVTMTLNDLRVFFSQPGNWVALTLLPILFTVGIGFAIGRGDGPTYLYVDVIDADESAASTALVAALQASNETLVLCPQDVERCDATDEPLTLAVAEDRVREGDSNALIVIPAGYGDALVGTAAGQDRVQIDFYTETPPTSPDPVRQSLDVALQQVNGASVTAAVVDAVLVGVGTQTGADALISPWRESFVQEVYTQTEKLLVQRPPAVRFESVGGESDSVNSASGFSQSVPGMGSMYVMFTVLGGMAMLQRERQRWTLQRLGVFPITRGQILAGKILTYFTLGMLQYLVVFAVGLAVGLDFGPNPWLLLPTMAAFVLCCTALTFAIAPMLTSVGQANVLTQLLSLTFASLGGAWWPVEIVPEFMQRLAYLTPVAWVMSAFRELLYHGGGLMDILPQLGVLLAAALILFSVGIWRFRYL